MEGMINWLLEITLTAREAPSTNDRLTGLQDTVEQVMEKMQAQEAMTAGLAAALEGQRLQILALSQAQSVPRLVTSRSTQAGSAEGASLPVQPAAPLATSSAGSDIDYFAGIASPLAEDVAAAEASSQSSNFDQDPLGEQPPALPATHVDKKEEMDVDLPVKAEEVKVEIKAEIKAEIPPSQIEPEDMEMETPPHTPPPGEVEVRFEDYLVADVLKSPTRQEISSPQRPAGPAPGEAPAETAEVSLETFVGFVDPLKSPI